MTHRSTIEPSDPFALYLRRIAHAAPPVARAPDRRRAGSPAHDG